MDKREHVRRAIRSGEHGGHGCHWPGCAKKCPPAAWGCKEHWMRLPKRIRDRIWAEFRPGQEEAKNPSRDYISAAQEAQNWIAENMTPWDRGWKYDL